MIAAAPVTNGKLSRIYWLCEQISASELGINFWSPNATEQQLNLRFAFAWTHTDVFPPLPDRTGQKHSKAPAMAPRRTAVRKDFCSSLPTADSRLEAQTNHDWKNVNVKVTPSPDWCPISALVFAINVGESNTRKEPHLFKAKWVRHKQELFQEADGNTFLAFTPQFTSRRVLQDQNHRLGACTLLQQLTSASLARPPSLHYTSLLRVRRNWNQAFIWASHNQSFTHQTWFYAKLCSL